MYLFLGPGSNSLPHLTSLFNPVDIQRNLLSCCGRITTRVVPSGMGTGRSNSMADILRCKHFSIWRPGLQLPVSFLASLLHTILVGCLAHPFPNNVFQGHTNVQTFVVQQWARTSLLSKSLGINISRADVAHLPFANVRGKVVVITLVHSVRPKCNFCRSCNLSKAAWQLDAQQNILYRAERGESKT